MDRLESDSHIYFADRNSAWTIFNLHKWINYDWTVTYIVLTEILRVLFLISING